MIHMYQNQYTSGRWQVPQVFETLPPMWEIQTELWTSRFRPGTASAITGNFGSELVGGRILSPYLSFE